MPQPNRKRRRNRRRRNQNGNNRNQAMSLVPLPRRPPRDLALPRMFRTTMVFTAMGNLTNAGAAGANTYLQLNYPAIPILSGANPASRWTDLILIYPYFRMLRAKVTFEASNQEAFATVMYGLPCLYGDGNASAPAANDVTTAADIRGVQSQPFYKDRILSATGSMDRGKFIHTFTMDQLFVAKWTGAPDDYTPSSDGGSVAPPTSFIYYLFGVYTVPGTVLTASNGVDYRITSEVDGVFFGNKVVAGGTFKRANSSGALKGEKMTVFQ